jgi:hypothetical protein
LFKVLRFHQAKTSLLEQIQKSCLKTLHENPQ